MSVSVVIPACGRPQLLRRCLHALAGQENAGAFEVIIVDDAGHPSATSAVNEVGAWFAAGTPLTLLRLPANAGPAAARNEGCRQAAYDVIAFTGSAPPGGRTAFCISACSNWPTPPASGWSGTAPPWCCIRSAKPPGA